MRFESMSISLMQLSFSTSKYYHELFTSIARLASPLGNKNNVTPSLRSNPYLYECLAIIFIITNLQRPNKCQSDVQSFVVRVTTLLIFASQRIYNVIWTAVSWGRMQERILQSESIGVHAVGNESRNIHFKTGLCLSPWIFCATSHWAYIERTEVILIEIRFKFPTQIDMNT